jgi:hypothetical protein
MIDKIITSLEKTVKDAIKNKKIIAPPHDKEKTEENVIIIPWVNERTKLIPLKKISETTRIPFPPIIDPEIEIPQKDEELEKEIKEQGIEALAWYVSFHQSSNWGIYFRIRGVLFLSNLFKTKTNLNNVNQRVKIAFEVLFYHEFFHFLTDLTAATMEMIYKKAIYNDYLEVIEKIKLLEEKGNFPFFELFDKVTSDRRHIIWIEEPLANAYVLHKISKKWHNMVQNKFFEIQPFPYNEYTHFVNDYKFSIGKRILGGLFRIVSNIDKEDINSFIYNFVELINSVDTEPFWEFLFNANPEKLFIPDIPIYFVFENEYTPDILKLSLISDGIKITIYPCDHPPSHLHIWIPLDSRKEIKCLYPSLEPFQNSRPLSNKEKKKVIRLIEQHKNKIDEIISKQKQTDYFK